MTGYSGIDFEELEYGQFEPTVTSGEAFMVWVDLGRKQPWAPWADTENPYSWSDPENWTDFDTALRWSEMHPKAEGAIRVIQSHDEPYDADRLGARLVFVDIDGPDDWDGELPQEILDDLDALGATYVERSQSGNGLHLFYLGRAPTGYESGLDVEYSDGFTAEIYFQKRVCALTGAHVAGTPDDAQPVNDDALESLCETHGTANDQTNFDPDAHLPSLSKDDLADVEVTTDFGDIEDAISHLTVDDISLHSEEVNRRGDGWSDWNPSWAQSESGTRLGVRPDRKAVVYRSGNHGGNVLHLVAWEERIVSPGERLTGKAFWEAVEAARERGAHIPELEDEEAAKLREATDALTEPDTQPVPPDEPSDPEPPDEQSDDTAAAGSDGGEEDPDEVAEEEEEEDSDDDPWEYVRTLLSAGDAEATKLANASAVRLTSREFPVLYTLQSDRLYTWNERRGIYEPHGEQKLGKALQSSRRLGIQYSSRRRDEIISRLKDRNAIADSRLNRVEWRLPVQNGILDITDPADPTLGSARPDIPFTLQLGAEYDPDATAPEFEQFLEEAVNPRDMKKLQEYAGYTLMSWAQPYAKALLLVGPTRSGKSTFIKILRAVIGEDACGNYSLSQIIGDDYALAFLREKLVNTRNEITAGSIRRIERFKELTSGHDGVTSRKPYGKEAVEYTPTVKFIYATNRVPQVDADEAFYTRWLHVPFPNTVPEEEQDKYLGERIIDNELSGVLNWMLEGLARLVDQNGRFSDERAMSAKMDLWMRYGSPVESFIQKYVEFTSDSGDCLAKNDVLQSYRVYCAKEGFTGSEARLSKNKLTRTLDEQAPPSSAFSAGKGVYSGIRYNRDPPGRTDDDDDSDNRQSGLPGVSG